MIKLRYMCIYPSSSSKAAAPSLLLPCYSMDLYLRRLHNHIQSGNLLDHCSIVTQCGVLELFQPWFTLWMACRLFGAKSLPNRHWRSVLWTLGTDSEIRNKIQQFHRRKCIWKSAKCSAKCRPFAGRRVFIWISAKPFFISEACNVTKSHLLIGIIQYHLCHNTWSQAYTYGENLAGLVYIYLCVFLR